MTDIVVVEVGDNTVEVTSTPQTIEVVSTPAATIEIVSGGAQGPPGPGVPSGGLAGEYLVKNSATNYDLVWTDRVHAAAIDGICKNVSGVTLPKGTPVYQTGEGGGGFLINVAAADAADPDKMPAIGVLGETLASEAEGQLLILGEIRGVDTSMFSRGDEVFVAPGGGYTNVAPTGSTVQVQFLGLVTKVHATNGGGYITGTGRREAFLYRAVEDIFQGWNLTTWHDIPKTSDLDILSLDGGNF